MKLKKGHKKKKKIDDDEMLRTNTVQSLSQIGGPQNQINLNSYIEAVDIHNLLDEQIEENPVRAIHNN